MVEYDVYGETRRAQRQTADMLHVLATGKRIDERVYTPYTRELTQIYDDPFGKMNDLQTGEEIINMLLGRG